MWSEPGPGLRFFTIEEADALIPQLDELVGKNLRLGDEIQKLVVDLLGRDQGGGTVEVEGAEAEVVDITVQPEDDDDVVELKKDLGKRVVAYRDGWEQVKALGVVVKDTSNGHVDFYSRIDDRTVWLSWEYGESGIAHYREVDAAFSSRKPLASVRERMLN